MQPRPQVFSGMEDALSARNFARLAAYIYEYSGIRMPSSKKIMLEGRLRRCARGANIETLDAYCEYIFDDGGLEAERTQIFDAVTTNKTDFFREPAHFDILAERVLPALLAAGRSKIKIWSSACSTGAEAYTLAMVMEEFARSGEKLDYSIFCTDLSRKVLEQAHRGVFAEQMIEPVPQALRQRYLMRARGARRDDVRIIPKLRSKHTFAHLNLMDDAYAADRDMDIIFCRNVLIYFDKLTQEKVLRRLCGHLRPGGFLFLGHSESLTGIDLPVQAFANTIFQRL
jgi:chemotaxis protein methyltransferase CheR